MTKHRRLPLLSSLLVPLFSLLVAMTAMDALARDPSRHDREHDHDRARQALEAGEVLPLRTILERVEREYPGRTLEVELESDHGQWLYEIKLLRPGGDLIRLKVDAADGRILGVRQRNRERRDH